MLLPILCQKCSSMSHVLTRAGNPCRFSRICLFIPEYPDLLLRKNDQLGAVYANAARCVSRHRFGGARPWCGFCFSHANALSRKRRKQARIAPGRCKRDFLAVSSLILVWWRRGSSGPVVVQGGMPALRVVFSTLKWYLLWFFAGNLQLSRLGG